MGIVLFILGLLKYILIAVLCVFAFIVLFAALIVFMPIRYDVRISYDNKFVMGAKVTWMLKIIKLIYSNTDETGRLKLTLFGFALFGKGENKKQKERKSRKKKSEAEDIEDLIREKEKTVDITRSNLNREDVKNITEDCKPDVKEPKDEPPEITADNNTPKEKKRRVKHTDTPPHDAPDEGTSDDKDAEEGVVGSLKGLLSKLKFILDYPDKNLIINATYKLIKRLFNAAKPKKVKLSAVIGFDDPYITGRAIGALAFIAGVNRIDLSLQGNFNEPELNFETEVKGKIILFRFIWPLIIYVLNKPIWKIVKPIIFRKDENDEQS